MKKVFLSFVTFALVASSGISLNAWGRGTIVEKVTMVNGIPLKTYSIGQTNSTAGKAQFREDERNLKQEIVRLDAEAKAEHDAAVKARGRVVGTAATLWSKAKGLFNKPTAITNVVASTRSCDAIPVETVRNRRIVTTPPAGEPGLLSRASSAAKDKAVAFGRGISSIPAAVKGGMPAMPSFSRTPRLSVAPADSTPAAAANTSASTDGSISAPATPDQDRSDDADRDTNRIVNGPIFQNAEEQAAAEAKAKAELQAAVAKAAEEAKLNKIAAGITLGAVTTGAAVAKTLAVHHQNPTFFPTALATAQAFGTSALAGAKNVTLPLAGAIATQMANSTPAQLAMSACASPTLLPAIAVGGTSLAAIYGYSKWVNRKKPAIGNNIQGAIKNTSRFEKAKAWIRSSKFFAPARFVARHKREVAAAAMLALAAYYGYNNRYTTAKQAAWMAEQVTQHGPVYDYERAKIAQEAAELAAKQAWNFGQEITGYATGYANKLTCPDPVAIANKTALTIYSPATTTSLTVYCPPTIQQAANATFNATTAAATMTKEQIGGLMGWFVNWF